MLLHLPIRIPPRYNLNIVESGIEHHRPKPNQSELYTDIKPYNCKIRKYTSRLRNYLNHL